VGFPTQTHVEPSDWKVSVLERQQGRSWGVLAARSLCLARRKELDENLITINDVKRITSSSNITVQLCFCD
jgi:hypothetical protein